MKLGVLSVSLNVKDIHASKAFHENLGFTVFAGDIERKYLILKNAIRSLGFFKACSRTTF
jgi:predicted lactoylglutathione lyase